MARRGFVPEALHAIYGLLGVRPWPYAKFSESGYLTSMSEAAYRPGVYINIGKDGKAKVIIIGEWKARWAATDFDADTIQLPSKPKNVRTEGLVQHYARALRLERESDKGKKYIPKATYDTLATLLLLRAGAIPAPTLAAPAADPFAALADAIFARVEAGEIRVEGAFGLARVCEILCRLQQAHTWLNNAGPQPAPLTPGFAQAVQQECEVPELRHAMNDRCTRYAGNRAFDAGYKLAVNTHKWPGHYDLKNYQTAQKRDALRLLENVDSGYEKYWKPERMLHRDRWKHFLRLAKKYGLIERVGSVEHSLWGEQAEDEHSRRPIALWSLAHAGLAHESEPRYFKPKRTVGSHTTKY